jgi:hypothetical protein
MNGLYYLIGMELFSMSVSLLMLYGLGYNVEFEFETVNYMRYSTGKRRKTRTLQSLDFIPWPNNLSILIIIHNNDTIPSSTTACHDNYYR